MVSRDKAFKNYFCLKKKFLKDRKKNNLIENCFKLTIKRASNN